MMDTDITLRMVEKPARRVLIKRGVSADNYWDYCQEVGCDLWDTLKALSAPGEEPVSLWLPDKYRLPGTSAYVQGVEMPLSDDAPVPEGFDVLTLPAAQYLLFQGPPFAEEDFAQTIGDHWQYMDNFNPATLGYTWDNENPRIQLEPVGTRGYMEFKAVKRGE